MEYLDVSAMVGFKVNSTFVISLDFEILWGVYEQSSRQNIDNLSNVYEVVPKILELFEQYGVAATWATVGALMSDTVLDFYDYAPVESPNYANSAHSSRKLIDEYEKKNKDLLFALNLVKLISTKPRQEIGSHTFSHYYCLEQGQSIVNFYEDICSNVQISKKLDLNLRSIVFPRNQYQAEYLKVCKNSGFTSYRGNPSHWAYRSLSRKRKNYLRRLFRLLDCYIPLSGPLTYKLDVAGPDGLQNIKASLFLRPYSKRLKFLQWLKLWRIKYSMRDAAMNGKIFHLWWHPHNFKDNIDENMGFLKDILDYYKYLQEVYGMKSLSMGDPNLHV